MGNYASRIHSKEDGKVYNILPLGDMPTVVFGRVIRENSVPGMQYYFPDGRVKWHVEDSGEPYEYVTPYGNVHEWGTPCIFTIPDNFEYSKLTDVEYVKQYCRTAANLNAKTTSPYYIIENGHIKCIKPLDAPGKYVVVACKRRRTQYPGGIRKVNSVCGEVSMLEGVRFSDFLNGHVGMVNSSLLNQVTKKPNKFTLIPVGRVKYKIKYENSETERIKYNTTGERHHFQRTVKRYDFNEGKASGWKLKEV